MKVRLLLACMAALAASAPAYGAEPESAAQLAAASARLGAAQKELVTFATTRIVPDKAVARVSGAVDAVRAAQRQVAALEARTAPPDAAYAEQVATAAREAASAAELAHAVTIDPAMVDAAAEEKERNAQAAIRAREAELARVAAAREAELARVAAARAAAEAAKEQARADAAKSAEEKRALAQSKHAATTRGLADVDVALGPMLATLAQALAIANLPAAERERTQQRRQRAVELQSRAKEIRSRADAAAQRGTPESLAVLTRAEADASVLLVEARTLAGGAPSAAADSSVVPSCLVSFTAPGLDGATLSLDGAKPVGLPAKLRVSSGRHSLAIAQGGRSHRRLDLLVCGRIDTLPLEIPR